MSRSLWCACTLAATAVLTLAAPARAQGSEAIPGWRVDGELRVRGETRDNADFNRLVEDSQSTPLGRLRVGITGNFGEAAELYVQLQHAQRNGRLVAGQPVRSLTMLHQAYLDLPSLADNRLALRVGRQEISLGEQRLIGAFEWSNLGRTFDAVRLTYRAGATTLDGFAANVVTRRYLPATSPPQGSLHGLYLSTGSAKESVKQAYVLLKSRAGNLWTLGGRVSTPAGPRRVDGMAELAYQTGRQSHRSRRSAAGVGRVGYTMPVAWSPRVGVEYAFSAGDRDPADGVVRTFDNLYPTNHPHYGIMDYFSWRNMHDLRLSLSARPSARLTSRMDFHLFRLDTARDAWYNAAGGVIRQDPSGAAGTHVGSELDFQASYRLGKRASIAAGYGHFFAGSYVKRLGPTADSDWGFIQTNYTF